MMRLAMGSQLRTPAFLMDTVEFSQQHLQLADRHHWPCVEQAAALLVGGIATSDWLERNFADFLGEHWSDGRSPERDITQAFLQVGPLFRLSPFSPSSNQAQSILCSKLIYCTR